MRGTLDVKHRARDYSGFLHSMRPFELQLKRLRRCCAGTETGYKQNFESWRPRSHGRYCTTKEERVHIDCNPLDNTGLDSCL